MNKGKHINFGEQQRLDDTEKTYGNLILQDRFNKDGIKKSIGKCLEELKELKEVLTIFENSEYLYTKEFENKLVEEGAHAILTTKKILIGLGLLKRAESEFNDVLGHLKMVDVNKELAENEWRERKCKQLEN